MPRRVPWAPMALMALASGCSYAKAVTAGPASADTRLTTSDIERANEVVRDVAHAFGLLPRRDPEYSWYLSHQSEAGGREIDRFTRASEDAEEAHGILLLVGVDEEGRAFFALIRNWYTMGETPFASRLSEAVAAALRREFPTWAVRVERLHDMPIFYVP
ncbi:MAG: hypothetical protein SFZ23_00010 [Planctomycetota bacterium]|nr:hypothetical protein [Planctomycetota bacterium]